MAAIKHIKKNNQSIKKLLNMYPTQKLYFAKIVILF
jgi:hypothetical protein